MSNMYDWIGETWNPLAGKCPHDCSYCYVKKGRLKNSPKYHGPIRLDERAMSKNLGKDKVYFVCSCNDLFADDVPGEFIRSILEKCEQYRCNTYVFQTKNPFRMMDFEFPFKSVIGVTIETNRLIPTTDAPQPRERAYFFWKIPRREDIRYFLTIEPIMDFDLEKFVDWIETLGPDFVNIGADSKGCGLPEPSPQKVRDLISQLEKFTEVRVKSNLKRIFAGWDRGHTG
ncbi:MAG: DUF5131 family protein [Methanoregulaceae archaeon]|nr:DUF5131 family protein [Methanoregulaceae archaeon]